MQHFSKLFNGNADERCCQSSHINWHSADAATALMIQRHYVLGCGLSRFVPGMSFVKYVGKQENRERLRNEILQRDNLTVIITSYQVCFGKVTCTILIDTLQMNLS